MVTNNTFSRLTSHDSRLTTHNSQLTIHNSHRNYLFFPLQGARGLSAYFQQFTYMLLLPRLPVLLAKIGMVVMPAHKIDL